MKHEFDPFIQKIVIEIYFEPTLSKEWVSFLQEGLNQIEKFAPRLQFSRNYFDSIPKKLKIVFREAAEYGRAFTRGCIFNKYGSEIFLSNDWLNKKRTSVHEILHALGFSHEQC